MARLAKRVEVLGDLRIYATERGYMVYAGRRKPPKPPVYGPHVAGVGLDKFSEILKQYYGKPLRDYLNSPNAFERLMKNKK